MLWTQSSQHQKAAKTSPLGITIKLGKPNLRPLSSSAFDILPVIPEGAPCQIGASARLIQESPSMRERLAQSPGLSSRRYRHKTRPSGRQVILAVCPFRPVRRGVENARPSFEITYGVGRLFPVGS